MSHGARSWRAGSRSVVLDRPILVGILNVTPDSFSDGGHSFSADEAVRHAGELVAAGTDVIDIGGESTRPGAAPVPVEEELRRVLPVVERVREQFPDVVISIDTVKAAVAEAALGSGADVINDVSAHRLDDRMSRVCGAAGCGVILMHSRGPVSEMATYQHAAYGNVVREVCDDLLASALAAEAAGVARDSIVLDPGIGFSKRGEHSVALLRSLDRLAGHGYPLMVGVSRKRVVGEISGVSEPRDRDFATAGVNVYALLQGARLFRVHNVRVSKEALSAAWYLLGEEAR